LRLSEDRFLRSQLLHKRLSSLKVNLMMRRRKLKTSRASLKIQKSIQRRENLREKMLILKLSRLRSRSWRRGLTTRKSHYWRKNLYTRKSPIWLRSSELKPLMVERVPSRLPKRSTSIRLEQLSSQGRCLPQFQSFLCSNPRLSSSNRRRKRRNLF